MFRISFLLRHKQSKFGFKVFLQRNLKRVIMKCDNLNDFTNTVSCHKAGKKSTKKSDCQMSSRVKQFGFVLVCIMSKNAQILAKAKNVIQYYLCNHSLVLINARVTADRFIKSCVYFCLKNSNWLHFYFSGESLSCYRCGTLNSNARRIEDCRGPNRVEECAPNEACVVFKRLYKKGSGKVLKSKILK